MFDLGVSRHKWVPLDLVINKTRNKRERSPKGFSKDKSVDGKLEYNFFSWINLDIFSLNTTVVFIISSFTDKVECGHCGNARAGKDQTASAGFRGRGQNKTGRGRGRVTRGGPKSRFTETEYSDYPTDYTQVNVCSGFYVYPPNYQILRQSPISSTLRLYL